MDMLRGRATSGLVTDGDRWLVVMLVVDIMGCWGRAVARDTSARGDSVEPSDMEPLELPELARNVLMALRVLTSVELVPERALIHCGYNFTIDISLLVLIVEPPEGTGNGGYCAT